jgi:hypothetical protein
MKLKRVYIAGPFRGHSHWEIAENVRRAERAILPIAETGHLPFCPHSMYKNFQGALPDQFWLDATMEWLRLCDCIYLGPGWWKSAGSKAERALAEELGLSVFTSMIELQHWLRNGEA